MKSSEDILFYSSKWKVNIFLLSCRNLQKINELSYASSGNLLNVLPLRTANFHSYFETRQRKNMKFYIFYALSIYQCSPSYSLFLEIWLYFKAWVYFKSSLIYFLIFSAHLTKNWLVCFLSRAIRLATFINIY